MAVRAGSSQPIDAVDLSSRTTLLSDPPLSEPANNNATIDLNILSSTGTSDV